MRYELLVTFIRIPKCHLITSRWLEVRPRVESNRWYRPYKLTFVAWDHREVEVGRATLGGPDEQRTSQRPVYNNTFLRRVAWVKPVPAQYTQGSFLGLATNPTKSMLTNRLLQGI